ncbi:hypothetical protein K432DRAFT_396094 [Lepidopterella palustris CBS 459.81]|uniref:Uncharacterized protein n=1 Tax=Lepidopterella palustris CBS 459.81 TaxID=1314670 RepID=A0A8E2JBZ8_9PEZI|nr:hypothetical protein K432DRAFT_396094 [Lepidopterella palustris CBS 459.81]
MSPREGAQNPIAKSYERFSFSPGDDISQLDESVSPESSKGALPVQEMVVKEIILTRAKQILRHDRAGFLEPFRKPAHGEDDMLQFLMDRLERGLSSPGPIKARDANDPSHHTQRAHHRTLSGVMERELYEFEYVYYALIGRTKDIHDHLAMRLRSNFITPDQPLHHLGEDFHSNLPFTVENMMNFLRETWAVCMHSGVIVALDRAVRRHRVLCAQGVTFESGFDVRDHSPESLWRLRASLRARQDSKGELPLESRGGLMNAAKMGPGQITAFINEKFRLLVLEERRTVPPNDESVMRHIVHPEASRPESKHEHAPSQYEPVTPTLRGFDKESELLQQYLKSMERDSDVQSRLTRRMEAESPATPTKQGRKIKDTAPLGFYYPTLNGGKIFEREIGPSSRVHIVDSVDSSMSYEPFPTFGAMARAADSGYHSREFPKQESPGEYQHCTPPQPEFNDATPSMPQGTTTIRRSNGYHLPTVSPQITMQPNLTAPNDHSALRIGVPNPLFVRRKPVAKPSSIALTPSSLTFVRAGGDTPVHEREEVDLDYHTPTEGTFSFPAEELLAKVDQLTPTFREWATNDHKNPDSDRKELEHGLKERRGGIMQRAVRLFTPRLFRSFTT